MSIHAYKKDPKRYHIRIRDSSGKTYSRVLAAGTTKPQAKKFEAQWKIDIDARSNQNDEVTLLRLFERWLTKRAIHLVDPENYESHARMIMPYLGNHTVNDVIAVTSHMKEDMQALGYAPGTINKRLSMIKTITKLAFTEWGYLEVDLSARIKKVKERPTKELYATYTELWKLYESCKKINTETAELMIFSAYTGIRFAEMTRLTTSSISTRIDGTVWLNIQHTKDGKPRSFPLPDHALNAYNNMREKFPMSQSYSTIIKRFKRAVIASHIADDKPELINFTWHDLRHSFASFLAQGGTSLIVLQKMLGHRTLSSTQRYAHLCDESYEAATSILNAPPPPKLTLIK